MQITSSTEGDTLELRIVGRLDAYWAEHLDAELTAAVREGHHHILLNMKETAFLSSGGIRVLVRVANQLRSIEGWLAIDEPSPFVRNVLELTGLDAVLLPAELPTITARESEGRKLSSPQAELELLAEHEGGNLCCRVMGDPAATTAGDIVADDCRSLSLPNNVFAIGLGAFGRDFADARSRFGEFLAVSGAVTYLPTDGGGVPDFLLAGERFIADIQTLHGVACEGEYSQVVSFEAKPNTSFTLTEAARQALEITGARVAGMVMIAEVSGLVGACLRRSPAIAPAELDLFSHPGIRDWLTLTSEAAHRDCIALVAGVVAMEEHSELAPSLRPLGETVWPQGHFHAAVFSFRPLKKGDTHLAETVTCLFEHETVHSVLHLLNDDRPIDGAGESEFARGTFWTAPIAEVKKGDDGSGRTLAVPPSSGARDVTADGQREEGL